MWRNSKELHTLVNVLQQHIAKSHTAGVLECASKIKWFTSDKPNGYSSSTAIRGAAYEDLIYPASHRRTWSTCGEFAVGCFPQLCHFYFIINSNNFLTEFQPLTFRKHNYIVIPDSLGTTSGQNFKRPNKCGCKYSSKHQRDYLKTGCNWTTITALYKGQLEFNIKIL